MRVIGFTGAAHSYPRHADSLTHMLVGHGLLIVGPVGTGKSSAAALLCQAAAEIGRKVRWSYVPDLLDGLGSSAKERAQEIRWQEMADLVVWDDFGVRDMADWEIGHLDQIVENRYRSRRPMVVTTNLRPEDLREDERLVRMMDRFRERVCSMGCVLGGTSMREVVG